MGLDEVHVSVFGQEGHQLVIGPEIEENDLVLTGKHMVRPRWNIDSAVQYMLKVQCKLWRKIMQINPSVTGCFKKEHREIKICFIQDLMLCPCLN